MDKTDPRVLAVWILDHYGHCEDGQKCECLRPGREWRGLYCPRWVPCGARNWKELAAWQKKQSGRAP